MINFIIVDDINFWINCVEERINKVLFKSDIQYKIHKFNDYNRNFYNVVLQSLENKVYILDIETESANGIDVARRIRINDKLADIIFLTAYSKEEHINKYLMKTSKATAFIYKNELHILDETLEEITKNFILEKVLIINTISNYNMIKIKDILFIETKNRKTLIHTINSIIKTSKNLCYLEEEVKKECDFFVKTHRACIVNINNVISFDFKDKKIIFFNNKKCYLLSKSYKSKIKNKLNSNHI